MYQTPKSRLEQTEMQRRYYSRQYNVTFKHVDLRCSIKVNLLSHHDNTDKHNDVYAVA